MVLVLAFIVTGLTLSQVADLEKQVATEQRASALEEWRFIHAKLRGTLYDAVSTSTNNVTFNETLRDVVLTLATVENEKGYEFVVELAGSGKGLDTTEWSYTTKSSLVDPDGGPDYVAADLRSDVCAFGDAFCFGGPLEKTDFDRANDGLLWERECLIDSLSSCIQAVALYVLIRDPVATIEETILVPLNYPE